MIATHLSRKTYDRDTFSRNRPVGARARMPLIHAFQMSGFRKAFIDSPFDAAYAAIISLSDFFICLLARMF